MEVCVCGHLKVRDGGTGAAEPDLAKVFDYESLSFLKPLARQVMQMEFV